KQGFSRGKSADFSKLSKIVLCAGCLSLWLVQIIDGVCVRWVDDAIACTDKRCAFACAVGISQ
ncbi:MAG: hypothetical protein KBG54_03465, partial [Oscillospiraceae bacterium]|nr:hypothetical protein [Oscillospiraceae bacterium]